MISISPADLNRDFKRFATSRCFSESKIPAVNGRLSLSCFSSVDVLCGGIVGVWDGCGGSDVLDGSCEGGIRFFTSVAKTLASKTRVSEVRSGVPDEQRS